MPARTPTRDTHTFVSVTLRFANGRSYSEAWTTPLRLGRAVHKAVTWTRRAASEAKVPGRSQVVAIDTQAETRKGAYDAAKEQE